MEKTNFNITALSGWTITDLVAYEQDNEITVEFKAINNSNINQSGYIAQVPAAYAPTKWKALTIIAAKGGTYAPTSGFILNDGKMFFITTQNATTVYITTQYSL